MGWLWERLKGWWARLESWWALHFSGVGRREAWGYGVWLTFGLIVAVPELWAAGWKDSAKWPTISSTVGDLEYRHTWVALVVVAVIVLSLYSAFRYPPTLTGVLPPKDGGAGLPGDPTLPYRTPGGGRVTLSTTPVYEVAAGLYFFGALVAIGVGTAIAAIKTDIDDEFAVGRTLYGLTAFAWVVLPSLLAWPKWLAVDVPYPTLYETVRSLEHRLRILALAVAGGLAILLIHLVLYPWPSIIPDVQRLHKTYECHPLEPAKHPLSEKQKAACRRLDEADVKPDPTSP
jgi:hypothetical protein